MDKDFQEYQDAKKKSDDIQNQIDENQKILDYYNQHPELVTNDK